VSKVEFGVILHEKRFAEQSREKSFFGCFCCFLNLKINLDHPFLKDFLNEKGITDFGENHALVDDEVLEQKMPRLASVGVTPELLRNAKLIPVDPKLAPKRRRLVPKAANTSGEIYFYDNFKTDYPPNGLPVLMDGSNNRKLWNNTQWTNMFHLHLQRDDGERPSLLAIVEHGWQEQGYLERFDYRMTRMFLACKCKWRDSKRHAQVVICWVAEKLILGHQEYRDELLDFKKTHKPHLYRT